ncbi:MAG: AAA family ATPase [Pseudonocardiaceae bacterium]
MSTAAVIMLGILIWVVMAIVLSLFVARMSRLRDSAVEPSLAPPVRKPFLDPSGEVMARFPAEPARFVGRAETMAAASTALAPASGRTAVVFHGMAGAGKTTCAVELAYRHQRAWAASAFWSAPTDTDQFGDALRLLALTLEAQLEDYGVAMVDKIATRERLENFLPTLTDALADAGLLLILDNLETLLTPEGQWRDLRWASLIGALTDHAGSSRMILTSRIVPAGLNPDTVLVRQVHTLSREESLLLARELPNLGALLRTAAEPGQAGPGIGDLALGRCVLTLAQGHPKLLELADAAAAEPSRLTFQLAEIEEAVDGATLAAFLTEDDTKLYAEQLLHTFTAWTITVAATLPAPARLLLQALCRIEETDRDTAVLGVNWAALWRRLDQPGEPPPLASLVAMLAAAALIVTDPIDDPADPNEPVRYRIHPGVVEAIHAATPEPVTAAVDAQLAAWWTVVGAWGIEQQHAGKDSRFMARAGLAATRYLLRQHHWNAASCLLEQALIRDGYSPVTSLAVIPLLRRIAKATGAPKDLVVLGAALRKVDPGEAETLLRRAYDLATTDGDDRLASTTAGDLVTLLRDQGKFREALTLASKKIEHTSRAGFGSWTQLSDQGRRLQILSMLGRHEQVLLDLPALRARIADLPDQRADNDRVDPWTVREAILDIGRLSAVALERWDDALGLNDEIASTKRRHGASPYETARTRFNNYVPLLHLGRLADVDQLLRDCQDVFDTAGDSTQVAAVYGARADLEDKRDHPVDAVSLQRTSLRLWYVHPDPRKISTAHHDLANYLSHTAGKPAEQRAHRLTASLLNHLTGNTRELTRTLGVLASELRSDTSGPHAPVLPTTLAEITRLVDADDGARFGNLVVALCPDPATAERVLADLLTTAASLGP